METLSRLAWSLAVTIDRGTVTPSVTALRLRQRQWHEPRRIHETSLRNAHTSIQTSPWKIFKRLYSSTKWSLMIQYANRMKVTYLMLWLTTYQPSVGTVCLRNKKYSLKRPMAWTGMNEIKPSLAAWAVPHWYSHHTLKDEHNRQEEARNG